MSYWKIVIFFFWYVWFSASGGHIGKKLSKPIMSGTWVRKCPLDDFEILFFLKRSSYCKYHENYSSSSELRRSHFLAKSIFVAKTHVDQTLIQKCHITTENDICRPNSTQITAISDPDFSQKSWRLRNSFSRTNLLRRYEQNWFISRRKTIKISDWNVLLRKENQLLAIAIINNKIFIIRPMIIYEPEQKDDKEKINNKPNCFGTAVIINKT